MNTGRRAVSPDYVRHPDEVPHLPLIEAPRSQPFVLPAPPACGEALCLEYNHCHCGR